MLSFRPGTAPRHGEVIFANELTTELMERDVCIAQRSWCLEVPRCCTKPAHNDNTIVPINIIDISALPWMSQYLAIVYPFFASYFESSLLQLNWLKIAEWAYTGILSIAV